MKTNKAPAKTNWLDPDDAPDLSAAVWQEHIAQTVQLGEAQAQLPFRESDTSHSSDL